MPRSQNPIDLHRRQQRKKELLKNKTTRIQARDERVKQTKSVAEVKAAIQALEKRGKAHLSHTEKQKLDRLNKELKLVKQAQQERPKQQQQQPQQAVPLTELDDPRKSVYWDEQLNPYGAPPPGKPRLYHMRGGGVTMDMKLAVVPGQEDEELVVEQQVVPPRDSEPLTRQEVPMQRRDIPPPPPPPPPPPKQQVPPPPPPPPPLPKEEPPKSTFIPPSLPPPSKAVQRSKKKRGKKKMAEVDIWASTEEVEYHRDTDQLDLEGTADPNVWYYRDSSQNVQGPFSTPQMHSWQQAGFFPPTTLVRKGDSQKFLAIAQIDWTKQMAKASGQAGNRPKESVHDRIAALKRQHEKQEAPDDSEMDQDRIAELRRQEEEPAMDVVEEESVEDRIAALRQQHEQQKQEEESVDDRIAALRAERKHEKDTSVEERIEALRNETGGEQNIEAGSPSKEPPAYPIDERATAEEPPPAFPLPEQPDEEPPAYPIGETDETEPPPAYYPLPDDMEGDAVAPYPTDLEYPVNDAYPVDDADAYPDVVGPYPTEEAVDESTVTEPPKKVFKADKEVVGLIPSHLQKRRHATQKAKTVSAKKPRTAATSKTNGSDSKSKSVADDYDDFMKEISSLK